MSTRDFIFFEEAIPFSKMKIHKDIRKVIVYNSKNECIGDFQYVGQMVVNNNNSEHEFNDQLKVFAYKWESTLRNGEYDILKIITL